MSQTNEIADAIGYAIGHHIRVQALTILAEGTRSPSELAEILDLGVSRVARHIKRLNDRGCIEPAGTKKVRNVTEHFYRLAALPRISSDTGFSEMSIEDRRRAVGLTTQAILVELFGSFRAQILEKDDDLRIAVECLELDGAGRRELAEELAASKKRVREIHARSEARRATSGETGTVIVVAGMAFDRVRPTRLESATSIGFRRPIN
jgi:DNA-binding transcriptional ArsR family regulator